MPTDLLVRFVSRVRPDVLLEMRELRELPLADLAAVRLDAEMDPGVLGQIGTVCERLAALGTLVRFGLAHVRLRVQLELRLRGEHLQQQEYFMSDPCNLLVVCRRVPGKSIMMIYINEHRVIRHFKTTLCN